MLKGPMTVLKMKISKCADTIDFTAKLFKEIDRVSSDTKSVGFMESQPFETYDVLNGKLARLIVQTRTPDAGEVRLEVWRRRRKGENVTADEVKEDLLRKTSFHSSHVDIWIHPDREWLFVINPGNNIDDVRECLSIVGVQCGHHFPWEPIQLPTDLVTPSNGETPQGSNFVKFLYNNPGDGVFVCGGEGSINYVTKTTDGQITMTVKGDITGTLKEVMADESAVVKAVILDLDGDIVGYKTLSHALKLKIKNPDGSDEEILERRLTLAMIAFKKLNRKARAFCEAFMVATAEENPYRFLLLCNDGQEPIPGMEDGFIPVSTEAGTDIPEEVLGPPTEAEPKTNWFVSAKKKFFGGSD